VALRPVRHLQTVGIFRRWDCINARQRERRREPRFAPCASNVPAFASADGCDNAIELTAAVAFTRHGAETKLVLPGLPQQKHNSRCDPALIKAIARGRAWFEKLATGRARSLQELAKRDGISRRYIRRLVRLAFLSPQLVEAILQGLSQVPATRRMPPNCGAFRVEPRA
jgi:hypothetical protein